MKKFHILDKKKVIGFIHLIGSSNGQANRGQSGVALAAGCKGLRR